MTFQFPLALLFLFIGVAGVGILGASEQFYVFAGVALLGGLVTVLVPREHNTYLIERRLLIDGDADQQEAQAAREAVADSPVSQDGAAASNQGPRTGA
ncbi:hypothetical protein M3E18_08190 [Kocuria sp. p3-SID1433]|uniref:hypothetical protein n=1 Tax=unclassified Kocuria TaxID=2649579 RepID=UPI0021A8131A|nr:MULTISPECIES: hypothetical protein [unclassified Kocuria]MCT1602337.1 hypothetical protein [Kocuria sp. p3-SID1428]MCT2180508.1 hypothetical protein [Kocuria sp. p3-SID1433]